MDKTKLKKIVAMVSIAILFINLLLLALKKYSPFVFWVILGIVAIVSISIIKLLK